MMVWGRLDPARLAEVFRRLVQAGRRKRAHPEPSAGNGRTASAEPSRSDAGRRDHRPDAGLGSG
ncbi:MAG: hypothetical protein EA406_05550 [Rhodospirillales bacterium]|nr:MAG: hypothetical protein EA406_05550 [Rhodospirillales bacterium]